MLEEEHQKLKYKCMVFYWHVAEQHMHKNHFKNMRFVEVNHQNVVPSLHHIWCHKNPISIFLRLDSFCSPYPNEVLSDNEPRIPWGLSGCWPGNRYVGLNQPPGGGLVVHNLFDKNPKPKTPPVMMKLNRHFCNFLSLLVNFLKKSAGTNEATL